MIVTKRNKLNNRLMIRKYHFPVNTSVRDWFRAFGYELIKDHGFSIYEVEPISNSVHISQTVNRTYEKHTLPNCCTIIE